MRPPTSPPLAPLLALAATLLPPPAVDAAPTEGDPRRVVLGAMRAELDRAMAKLRLPGYEAPYFIEFAVRDEDHEELVGRVGALHGDHHKHDRHAYVEVRVGDYQFDNTSDDDDQVFDLDGGEGYTPSTEAPLDDDPVALRGALWLLADEKYKRALAEYARKRGRRATQVSEDEGLPSFSREQHVEAIEAPAAQPFDHAREADRVRRASALFKRWPEIFESSVRINVERVTRYLVNSEGTAVVTSRTIYGAYLAAATRAKDGMLLEHEKSFYAASPEELPDDAALAHSAEELAAELGALREAPVVDPYTGPAILMQQAAGVFFHETVGHRLEGERQNNEKEGRTFKGQIGQRILPEFLSVHDDPTRRRVADVAGGKKRSVSLNGYYLYDDEGVPARDVTLIDRGVLRDYLMSRSPIRGSLHSNGHGRAEGTGDPMGRMANLVVSSTRQVSEAALKKMLLDEVRRQGKPFGLIIRDITGGATNTSNYGFQAFKGQPRLVYRIDAKSGAETLVRGVEMVGTPLASINKIVAASDTVGVFNGFCGAESGYVPVSTVAPAVLFSEIELQRSERALERPQILPPPWK
jgi:predicted Zn-dependent protease